MKHINKNTEPALFENWKTHNPNGNWNDFADFKGKHYNVYQNLRNSLISEQDEMCCYCEIALKESIDAHIEHFKDKDNNPKDTFKFQNLFASCQNKDSCGHKKGGGNFSNLISPLSNDVESKFTYTGNGKIIPKAENDKDAEKTIEILGLNCQRLKDQRYSIIQALENTNSTYIQNALQNCTVWYNGFWTLIKYMNNKIII